MAIHFFSEDVKLPVFKKAPTKEWLKTVILNHGMWPGTINYIFTSDDFLLEINKKYLQHDYYTDIITFDNTENTTINGDIYISIDRVIENAREYQTADTEIYRVMIHGVLHLLGYDDSSEESKTTMRKAEDECLAFLK